MTAMLTTLTVNRSPERQARVYARKAGLLIPGATRVSETGAADYLGITPQALMFRRRRGTGPVFYHHQGRIAYDVTEIKRYAAAKGMVV